MCLPFSHVKQDTQVEVVAKISNNPEAGRKEIFSLQLLLNVSRLFVSESAQSNFHTDDGNIVNWLNTCLDLILSNAVSCLLL